MLESKSNSPYRKKKSLQQTVHHYRMKNEILIHLCVVVISYTLCVVVISYTFPRYIFVLSKSRIHFLMYISVDQVS